MWIFLTKLYTFNIVFFENGFFYLFTLSKPSRQETRFTFQYEVFYTGSMEDVLLSIKNSCQKNLANDQKFYVRLRISRLNT